MFNAPDAGEYLKPPFLPSFHQKKALYDEYLMREEEIKAVQERLKMLIQ